MWPFNRLRPEPLTPVELRGRLIAAAASGSKRTLRAECQKFKGQVAQHLDVLKKLPDDIAKDDGSIDRHVQCLIAVAQCLANECGSPELWNELAGPADDSPFVDWDRWFTELPGRMARLEYEALISEAKVYIEKASSLRGTPARVQEALLWGRLGELLFHSGRVEEAVKPLQSALTLCLENHDLEGQIAYLSNLIEVHRYLADGEAATAAQQLLDVKRRHGLPTGNSERQLKVLKDGEPLCRVTCVRDEHEMELDEITDVGDGSYRFQFRRNRSSLQKAVLLTAQGNEFASQRQYSNALEKYQEASEVDPHDPDPIYQEGMCLLELGAFSKAREAFEEVERLAPGWFRCRSDRWLAEGLEMGTISDEEFQLVRTLDDGGLSPAQAYSLANQGIERFPEFAPLYFFLGNNSQDQTEAIAAYRRGLELVEEPDLESRLLCALAGRLPVGEPERTRLIERAVSLKGSLVASATAKLMGLQ